MQRLDLAGLTTRVVGAADAPVTVVLLHGFGAPGDDLVSLSQAIVASARYAFPAAPLALGGMYGDARAWWLIDFAQLEREMRAGKARDRATPPEGLAEARAKVGQLVAELPRAPGSKLVLGGFSQGSMLALDVALHLEMPPDGLVLLSSTLIAQSEWAPRMARLAGVPVLQAHGQRDPLLPFAVAEELRDQLRAAGAVVDWVPFNGAHEIPGAVLDAVGAFVRARADG